MRITTEETIMYHVMKAIYDSGIPISFKGAMVLKACPKKRMDGKDSMLAKSIYSLYNDLEKPLFCKKDSGFFCPPAALQQGQP